MAAANLAEPYDPEAAEKLSKFDAYAAHLSGFARYVHEEVRTWRCEDPFRKLRKESGEKIGGVRARLDWLLKQPKGIFIVQPVVVSGGNTHVIGVACEDKLILDPMEENALRLCRGVLGLCEGGGVNECVGIGEIRELIPLPQHQGRKRLRRSSGKQRKRSESEGAGGSEDYCNFPRVG